jgi:hypothetical protein
MLSLLWTLLIGLVVGAVAKFLMPGKDPGGCCRHSWSLSLNRILIPPIVWQPSVGLR